MELIKISFATTTRINQGGSISILFQDDQFNLPSECHYTNESVTMTCTKGSNVTYNSVLYERYLFTDLPVTSGYTAAGFAADLYLYVTPIAGSAAPGVIIVSNANDTNTDKIIDASNLTYENTSASETY